MRHWAGSPRTARPGDSGGSFSEKSTSISRASSGSASAKSARYSGNFKAASCASNFAIVRDDKAHVQLRVPQLQRGALLRRKFPEKRMFGTLRFDGEPR